MKGYGNFWSEKLEGADHLEDVRAGLRIILKWVLGELSVKLWIG